MIRSLRGKYFTVKHVTLENCGHKLDMINEPATNCENCWWTFFNTHPQLVETTDQFFRTQGKGPLVAMRGKKYFKMFVRYMATLIHFMKEEGRLSEPSNQAATDASSVNGTTDEGGQREVASEAARVVSGGEAESNQVGDDVVQ